MTVLPTHSRTATSPMGAITAVGPRKTHDTGDGVVEAVRAVDLDVADGEVSGFLGPNRAGTSTIVRMPTTLRTVSAGSACLENGPHCARSARTGVADRSRMCSSTPRSTPRSWAHSVSDRGG